MVFSSHIFLFYFLPAVLLIYYALPRGKNLFLLIASYVFYGWWHPEFIILMLFATAVNYFGGLVISKSPLGSPRRRWALIASVAVSLSTLGFFKYFMFFEENVNYLLGALGGDPFPIMQITLPIGISFYIFQSLSYTVDVYRQDSPPVRSFTDFACFVALFPQLIAGPIVRYHTVAEQLIQRDHTMPKFASGVAMFVLGFAKKILLANGVSHIADSVFAADSMHAVDAWFGVTAYAFQIYFDFSAYSDMAIGLGRMIGFEFCRNFDSPYLSQNITEFWRRWHISLSTFLRDYLYVPLGGNRRGPRRTYINLALVMLLGGLWHGANWVFICWGAYHGAILAFERWMGKRSLYGWLPKPARIACTFVLVLFSWVWFRSPNFTAALHFFAAMFGASGHGDGALLLPGVIYTQGSFILMALCALISFQPIQSIEWAERITWPKIVVLIALFAFSIMTMSVQSYNPFLYFQF